MPLCVLKGSDGVDSFCSSHDLLASAIAVHYLTCRTQPVSDVDNKQRTQCKIDILQRLQKEMHRVVDHKGTSQEMYDTFQTFFREYMLMYQQSQDLRFMPISSVDSSSILIQQARSHVEGIGVMESSPLTISSDRYEDVITTYANIMHAYGCE